MNYGIKFELKLEDVNNHFHFRYFNSPSMFNGTKPYYFDNFLDAYHAVKHLDKKHKYYTHKIKVLDRADIKNKKLFPSYQHFLEYVGYNTHEENTKEPTELNLEEHSIN